VTVTANGQTLASFQPTTAGEQPYVYDLDSSSVGSGSQFGYTTWRFADGTTYFIYKFIPPAGTTSMSMSVVMWNQYLVEVTNTSPQVTVGFPDLRDYLIANKALVFWLDPLVPEEASLFASILTKVAPDTPYLGWFVGGHEDPGVTLCSQHGIPVLAADFFTNATVWAGVPGRIKASQPAATTPPLANKVYVTITMSDGDNLQFDEHQLRKIWDDPQRGKVPINWSIDPLLIEAAPAMWAYYQRTQTANDLLVAAPSGAGYTYPGDWPSSMLDSYTQRTGELMKQSALDIIYILNRDQGNSIPLTDAVAESYLKNVQPLPGILYNGDSPSTVTVSAGTLPVITEPNITSASGGESVLSSAVAGWDGKSPLFVAIMPIAWNMAPADVITMVNSLGSQYEVVRADVFFNLLRQHLGLPPA
jgi:hypothetical protein